MPVSAHSSGGFKGDVGAAAPCYCLIIFFEKPLFPCKTHIDSCVYLMGMGHITLVFRPAPFQNFWIHHSPTDLFILLYSIYGSVSAQSCSVSALRSLCARQLDRRKPGMSRTPGRRTLTIRPYAVLSWDC